jgi:hypothetical protein
MPRRLPILDLGRRGKTDPAQPETYRSHPFTTIEIKTLRTVCHCPSALSVSDKIEGTVLLSDTRPLPV